MDGWNLVLGLLGAVLWASVMVRWYTGAEFDHYATSALVVAMAAVNIVLIFGSLRLLDAIPSDLWDIVGTGGRIVFDLCAIVALLDSVGRPGTSRAR